MFLVFGFLLMIAVGCCRKDQNFEIKSVAAQQAVNFSCPRDFQHQGTMFWIREISGHQLEVLGGTFSFNHNEINQTPHFTTQQEPEAFILHIPHIEMTDSGLYYCVRTANLNMTVLKGIFLKVQGPRSSVSGIVQAPPPDVVRPGESVSLQCSVLSDSERKTCPEDYRVFWYKAGSDQSHPRLIYTDGDDAECGNSSQKCFYSFSNVRVSDAGTYYCAVAACGEVMIGNGAKLDVKDHIEDDLKSRFLYSLGAAFVATVIISLALIWTNEKKDCNRVKSVVIYSSLSETEDKIRCSSQQ